MTIFNYLFSDFAKIYFNHDPRHSKPVTDPDTDVSEMWNDVSSSPSDDPTMFLYIVSEFCQESFRQRWDRMAIERSGFQTVRHSEFDVQHFGFDVRHSGFDINHWIRVVTHLRDLAAGLDYLHKQGILIFLKLLLVISH